MKPIKISKSFIDKAKSKSDQMGQLRNSITKGAGNVHGFLGEIITVNELKAEESNTYDYDIKLNNLTIDVKTKRVTTPPRSFYECSVAALNTKQKCDFYVFTRILKNMELGWILGYISKEDYFKKANFLKKGTVDPSNGWTVSTDCYNLPISDLKSIEELKHETN
tara:strand:- start:38 stop:532 length:495 start_codon:yes stop_codon:yes gene_type:complete